jgi:hypothetical protein
VIFDQMRVSHIMLPPLPAPLSSSMSLGLALRRLSNLRSQFSIYPPVQSVTTMSQTPTFPVSPVPPNPLGDDNYIKTAACLIIGDEVLNGKTKANSAVTRSIVFS